MLGVSTKKSEVFYFYETINFCFLQRLKMFNAEYYITENKFY